LSTEEAHFVGAIMSELSDTPWGQPLLRVIRDSGGLCWTNKTLFFELRFGYALHQAGIAPLYETTGEGGSTVDFGFTADGQDWLVELMRLEETDAVRRATHSGPDQDGVTWSAQVLSTNANDPTQSSEGETLKAVQRICQKCERHGRSHKFPQPAAAYHVILIDCRTFLHGSDAYDRLHVGLGGEYLPPPYQQYWAERLISGVFSPHTPVRGAVQARERVHFLGFVNEQAYESGAIGPATEFIANPHLLESAAEAWTALSSWPLAYGRILNAPE
jgi:hypothetical protein